MRALAALLMGYHGVSLFGDIAVEAGVTTLESQTHAADGAVALLADDDLGDALGGAVGIVNLVTVNEADQIGVLLDRAGFSQIRHDGPFIPALFQTAIELR